MHAQNRVPNAVPKFQFSACACSKCSNVPNFGELRAPLSASVRSWGAFFSMKGGKGGERGGKGKRVKVKLGSVLLYEGGERGRKRGEREEGQSAN